MKLFLGIIGFMLSYNQTFAQFESNSSSEIDANLRCKISRSGEIAINTISGQVWQTDPGEEEGIAVDIETFNVRQCEGCLNFEGSIMGGLMLVKGDMSSYKLTYEVSQGGGDWEKLGSGKCRKVRKIKQ
jgi:hypothetical protein